MFEHRGRCGENQHVSQRSDSGQQNDGQSDETVAGDDARGVREDDKKQQVEHAGHHEAPHCPFAQIPDTNARDQEGDQHDQKLGGHSLR